VQPPKVSPCPQCGSNATVKVSALVAAGTALGARGGLGFGTSIDASGPAISVSSAMPGAASQSLLAAQLALPKSGYRGQDMRNAGLILSALLIVLIIVQFNPLLVVALICTVIVAVAGEYQCGMEKVDARLVWDKLYYCRINHLVYVGNAPEKSAPADRLGDYLVSRTLRRKYLDPLGHLPL
jgi:hypothetical protein